jgi:hypothetical protein
MRVWMTDTISYDARGGDAQVFATLEGAKRAISWVKEWEQDGENRYVQKVDNTISGQEAIWLVEVGP